MARRDIFLEQVREVLGGPEQRFAMREGREMLQSRLRVAGKLFRIRVLVDADREPSEVITVYRASRIDKHWRLANESYL